MQGVDFGTSGLEVFKILEFFLLAKDLELFVFFFYLVGVEETGFAKPVGRRFKGTV